MKVIVAIDSFKGCLTSVEANLAATEGVHARIPNAEVVQIPVSDGGEGWLVAFQRVLGGRVIEHNVQDPLMRPIKAQYLIKGETAVIEIAKASGLTLLTPEERNPLETTSYGTGQLVMDAIRRGCEHIVLGLGGSATSDCGIGMLRAIIDSYTEGRNCKRSRLDNQTLTNFDAIIKDSTWNEIRSLNNVRFTIATDVTNPLCGKNGAAYVFAPQKGATPEMVFTLESRAKQFAEASAQHFGYDRQNVPGAGAAGGLGYAFLQYLNADCRSGIDLLLETVDFGHLLKGTDLVITGEGSADRQTLMGKLPYGILQRAKAHHVPVILIAGHINNHQELLDAGFSQVECINTWKSKNNPSLLDNKVMSFETSGLSMEEAMKPETAKKNISKTIVSLFSDKYYGKQQGLRAIHR